jgi:hypothetical protein
LSYIPFAALPLPAIQKPKNAVQPAHANPDLLIAKREIIYLPSASALAVLRRELAGRKLPPKAVAVIADPVFNKDEKVLHRDVERRAETGGGFASGATMDAEAEAMAIAVLLGRGHITRGVEMINTHERLGL